MHTDENLMMPDSINPGSNKQFHKTKLEYLTTIV